MFLSKAVTKNTSKYTNKKYKASVIQVQFKSTGRKFLGEEQGSSKSYV